MCLFCVNGDSRIDRLRGPARFEPEMKIPRCQGRTDGRKLSLDLLALHANPEGEKDRGIQQLLAASSLLLANASIGAFVPILVNALILAVSPRS